MNKLYGRFRTEYDLEFKNKNSGNINQYRFLLGELSRGSSKIPSDSEFLSIFNKLRKSFNEELKNGRFNKHEYQIYESIFDEYLPKQVTKEEVANWISTNIDFKKYKTKMQAMKDIMSHFGQSADGKEVKEILENNF